MAGGLQFVFEYEDKGRANLVVGDKVFFSFSALLVRPGARQRSADLARPRRPGRMGCGRSHLRHRPGAPTMTPGLLSWAPMPGSVVQPRKKW